MTSFVCWWPTPMFKDRGCWCKTRQKLSSTSQSCRQHISSPTSVTNIDVAIISPVKATAVICEEVSQAITGYQPTFKQITQIKRKHGQNNNTDTNCSLFLGHVLHKGLHRCWWRMLETKCVGDYFKILVTVLAISVTTNLYLWALSARSKFLSPTFSNCHEL